MCMLSWGEFPASYACQTDDAISSSGVMHIHVCLRSVGTDWNVPEPWTLLVHKILLVII